MSYYRCAKLPFLLMDLFSSLCLYMESVLYILVSIKLPLLPMSILYSSVSAFCFQFCNYYWHDTIEIENFWSYYIKFTIATYLSLLPSPVSWSALHFCQPLVPACSGFCIPTQSGLVSHILNSSCHRLGTSRVHVCFYSLTVNTHISSTCFGSI